MEFRDERGYMTLDCKGAWYDRDSETAVIDYGYGDIRSMTREEVISVLISLADTE